MTTETRRARPMAPDQRREAILNAVIPLIFEHGPTVTSRQIAEAAGVAEGTLFRAFDDKDSIVRAAVDKYFEPEAFRERLRHIPRDQPLESKVRDIVTALRERFTGVVRLAGLVGDPRSAPQKEQRRVFAELVGEILAPDADDLTMPPERVGQMARMLAFAASIPAFNCEADFDDDELTRVLLYGVTRRPGGQS
ncbi:TetR/AcrR family transcriptional regulator [Microbacterium sp. MPKO10]|uniref:TetR/AcrR family transcriptional regulator n=1 Tax=Microbacterium sp. MPKO10 TaxID=2989818 RepID=UPI002236AF22|nr:TetR/AcrR family transcriptional regulator [Microbacterium sp. MPKO10]MCW4458362.1 TetR/AcrR family transcriptional regulator [Microbacterium sp. MPKO10]